MRSKEGSFSRSTSWSPIDAYREHCSFCHCPRRPLPLRTICSTTTRSHNSRCTSGYFILIRFCLHTQRHHLSLLRFSARKNFTIFANALTIAPWLVSLPRTPLASSLNRLFSELLSTKAASTICEVEFPWTFSFRRSYSAPRSV